MSEADDRAAEIETLLDQAWQKCLYGRTYSPAHQLARKIENIRLWKAKRDKDNPDPTSDEFVKKYFDKTARLLLRSALTKSGKLREVADALDAVGNPDRFQESLFKTWAGCVRGDYPPTVKERTKCVVICSIPTFAQLKDAFARKFSATKWRGDYSVRKTLKMLGLPLSMGKRGPAVNSQPVIRNRKG